MIIRNDFNWRPQADAFGELCLAFDPILDDEKALSPQEAMDLLALARLFGLGAADRDPAEIWKELRGFIAQEIEASMPLVHRLEGARRAGRSSPQNPSHCCSRVLIIENDIALRALLVEILSDAGHQVVGAVATRAEAASLLAEQPVDVAIIGLNLASGVVPDGRAVCSAAND